MQSKIHFLHIGKTGGSAIKYALGETKNSSSIVFNLHPHSINTNNIPEGEKFFFFLRNPIDRFISGFYSRQRCGRPRYNSPWSVDEKKAFEHFQTPNQLATALSSPNDKEKELAIFSMQHIQHVRDSFWKWLISKDTLQKRFDDIIFIGQQENLENDLKILTHTLKIEDLKLPDNDIIAHRNPGGLNKELSFYAIRNLTEWYQSDFEAVEFCRSLALTKGWLSK